MSDHASRARHDAHTDNRNEHIARLRVAALEAQEMHARASGRLAAALALAQQPLSHEFRTPIVDRFDRSIIRDHMLAPGSIDDTGFAPGCVV